MIVGISLLISALCSLLEACLLSMSHTDIAEISENSPKMDTIWNNFKDNTCISPVYTTLSNKVCQQIC